MVGGAGLDLGEGSVGGLEEDLALTAFFHFFFCLRVGVGLMPSLTFSLMSSLAKTGAELFSSSSISIGLVEQVLRSSGGGRTAGEGAGEGSVVEDDEERGEGGGR